MEKCNIEIHDKIVKELYEKQSIASFIWVISQGRELELSYHATQAFVSRDRSDAFVSLWTDNDEQAFKSMEELYENAVIARCKLCDIWSEITLGTLF